MDAKLKQKWVEALRSGKYAQANGALYDGNGYCCLGVCHLLITGEIPARMWDSACGYPPPAPIRAIPEDIRTRLANMNDNGKSFHEIADYIEKNL